jgi:hypothetical protein
VQFVVELPDSVKNELPNCALPVLEPSRKRISSVATPDWLDVTTGFSMTMSFPGHSTVNEITLLFGALHPSLTTNVTLYMPGLSGTMDAMFPYPFARSAVLPSGLEVIVHS